MSQMKELKKFFEKKMREMREQAKLDMVREFDERQFGTDGYFETERVIKRMEELHGNILVLIEDWMVVGWNALVEGVCCRGWGWG